MANVTATKPSIKPKENGMIWYTGWIMWSVKIQSMTNCAQPKATKIDQQRWNRPSEAPNASPTLFGERAFIIVWIV